MRTWLVTGGTGFLGRHILDTLADGPTAGDRVVGLARRPPKPSPGIFVAADLDSGEESASVLSAIRPDIVIHAAGRTPPATPEEFYRANTLATLHLLDALRSLDRPARVVLVGSAAELGPVAPDRLPVGEDEPTRPVDPYGLSKLLATTAGMAARAPLEVVSARVFNPIGPGLPTSQALGRFAAILAGSHQEFIRMEVGDLDASRDFVDVRDVASAIIALADRGRAGSLYHVGTGTSRGVRDGLNRLIAMSDRRVEVVSLPRKSSGPSDSRADIRRIEAETGWSPRISWEESLADLWADAVDSVAIDRARGRP